MERYAEISRMIMEVFASFSPLVEPLSLDEAFIDCTGTERLFGDPLSLGRLIKSKVFETTGLRVSVGIAANKFVAKVASDLQKPDGLTICPEGGEAEFLRNLPIRKLWGVGPKTAEVLARKKINTIGDLSDFGEEASIRLMGDHGRTLYQLSLGKDSRPVLPSSGRKSISEERTFRTDKTDREELTAVLFRLADEVSHKMRFEKIKGKTIQIKIRQSNFHTITRSLTLPKATSESEVISNETISLFKKNDPGGAIRLVGVGMTNFSDESDELDLFSFSETTKSQKVDRLLDTLRDRFDDKISRAVFIKKE
jgi:nucleotidyltransferase/DNA polymerase involved in DNA repair